MNIYCVQLNIAWHRKQTNFARVRVLLAAAAPAPGSLVLLPEMFATGFSMSVDAIRQGRQRETEKFLAETARRFDTYVVGGLVTANSAGRGSNQALAYSPKGTELARYAKLQPFTPGGESKHYDAGREVAVFDWLGMAVSPFICYDLRFPEHFRRATQLGAELIVVIANWPVGRIQHWITLLQARAIENQACVAGVNRCGSDPKLVYTGRSLIISPRGEILADAGNGECVISAAVDRQELLAYRKALPFLADARTV